MNFFSKIYEYEWKRDARNDWDLRRIHYKLIYVVCASMLYLKHQLSVDKHQLMWSPIRFTAPSFTYIYKFLKIKISSCFLAHFENDFSKLVTVISYFINMKLYLFLCKSLYASYLKLLSPLGFQLELACSIISSSILSSLKICLI